jgi:tRNA (Thr-GGU) A37 N-methylase
MADQSDPKLGCSCPAPGAAGCPEDPSRPDRPLSHHRVTVRDVAKNRLRIGPIEGIDGTPVVDIKPVLCEVQET